MGLARVQYLDSRITANMHTMGFNLFIKGLYSKLLNYLGNHECQTKQPERGASPIIANR